jgi:hypothetical protein
MHLSHHHNSGSRRQPSAFQKGYVLVMFALLLVPMLLVAGLSVDIGLWYNRAADMRKAADAAALAGVVWLPDEAAARTAALAAAERNGFTNGGNVTVSVSPSTVSSRRLRVSITDDRVGSFFWGNLGGRDINLTRTSFAEYVLPVPMGSPRNFIGTGLLLEPAGTPYANEELYMSINPYCTDKVNGDRHQSGYDGGTCAGTQNGEYRSNGYETYIEVPANPSGAIDVLLYDARYNDDGVPNNQVVGTDCTYPGWQNYQPYRQAGWGGVTLWGALRYQTWNGSRWVPNDGNVIHDGESAYISRNTYYRVAYPTGPGVCGPVYGTEPAIDDYRQDGQEPYTFSLYGADNTPLNDSDNPLICTQTFEHDTPFNYGPYLGSVRWNRLCTITNPQEGRYILRARNGGAITNPQGDGSNQYGVVARYASAANPGLCDGRNDNRCPRVFGKEALSVRAASVANVAQFFLAEIAPEHTGKTLRLELFDPGEGGRYIRILRPNGTNSWTPVSFSWSAPGVGNGTTSNLAVRDGGNDRFNGRTLTIDVPLSGYTPPSDNFWWKIEYEFAGSDVRDRTTWTASVLGDPIHLVEEF